MNQLKSGQGNPVGGEKDLLDALSQLASYGEEGASAMVEAILTIIGPEKLVAMEVLHTMGTAALPGIERGLQKGDAIARRHFLRVLSKIGGPEAVALARRLANDPDDSVAEAAKAVLEGRPVPGTEKLQLPKSDSGADGMWALNLTQWLIVEGLFDLNRPT